MSQEELTPAGNLEADFRAIGKAAQILPAYIRIICQTRIDGRAEPELLEISKQIALQKIETARAGMGEYAFFDQHESIISDSDPSHILALLDREIDSPTKSPMLAYVTNACPLQAHHGTAKTAKTKCWYCPVITNVIKTLKKETKP